MDTERLFVAVRVSPELRKAVGLECQGLAQKLEFAKWTNPEDYHITLQFLGDTAKEIMPDLIAALRKVPETPASFRLSMQEWGTFGAPAAPRVLWAGVGGELDKLHALQQAVTSATLPLGFTGETREYKPHITLARKYRGDIPYTAELLRTLKKDAAPQERTAAESFWTVNEFVLFATRMNANPMYEIVENMAFH